MAWISGSAMALACRSLSSSGAMSPLLAFLICCIQLHGAHHAKAPQGEREEEGRGMLSPVLPPTRESKRVLQMKDLLGSSLA